MGQATVCCLQQSTEFMSGVGIYWRRGMARLWWPPPGPPAPPCAPFQPCAEQCTFLSSQHAEAITSLNTPKASRLCNQATRSEMGLRSIAAAAWRAARRSGGSSGSQKPTCRAQSGRCMACCCWLGQHTGMLMMTGPREAPAHSQAAGSWGSTVVAQSTRVPRAMGLHGSKPNFGIECSGQNCQSSAALESENSSTTYARLACRRRSTVRVSMRATSPSSRLQASVQGSRFTGVGGAPPAFESFRDLASGDAKP